jgi:tetratricopeptide (TPR) repeat protein
VRTEEAAGVRDRAGKYRKAVMLLGRFGLHRSAARLCRWSLSRCPECRAEFLVLLAHFTAEAGNLDSAVDALDLCARENPEEADALLGLAGIHCEKQGRLQEAASYYERALLIDGEMSEDFRADLRDRLDRCWGAVP